MFQNTKSSDVQESVYRMRIMKIENITQNERRIRLTNKHGRVVYMTVDGQDFPYNVGDMIDVTKQNDKWVFLKNAIGKNEPCEMHIKAMRTINQYYRDITLINTNGDMYVYRERQPFLPELKVNDDIIVETNNNGQIVGIQQKLHQQLECDKMIVTGVIQEEYSTIMHVYGKIFGEMTLHKKYTNGESIADFVQRGDVLEIKRNNNTVPPAYEIVKNITVNKMRDDFMNKNR
ncbi:MAG: hypothetical protein IJ560_01475 [Alphaproteobacteria bacterium]|nr:hypothetical protein [Alphaproteobacteria bacterium]